MKKKSVKIVLCFYLLLPLYAVSNEEPVITRKNKIYCGIITDLCTGVVLSNSGVLITSAGIAGQVLTSNGPGVVPSFQFTSASSIIITGDTGGPLTGSSFTFTGGATGLTFNGTTGPNTETLGGTLVVAHGGTGDTSFTPFAVITGGTTSTGALQSVATVGTAGQVLTSNGAGALPTFQPATSSITIDGDTGSATGNPITIEAGVATLNSGSSVKFVGSGSILLLDVTDASNNTILGNGAGNLTLTGTGNSGFGKNTLHALTSGSNNTAVGLNALTENTASNNTAVGSSALAANITGTSNTAVGTSASATATAGISNTAIGYFALRLNTANNNTAVGSGALENSTTGTNTAVGSGALGTNIGGTQNTAVGYNALALNSTGIQNVAVGDSALTNNTVSNNVAVGYNALNVNTTGSRNTAVGSGALAANQGGVAPAGVGNVAIGASALPINTVGYSNVVIGNQTGIFNVSGFNNTYIGTNAGNAETAGTGSNNIYIGAFASGVPGENATTRIGIFNTTDQCFVNGIWEAPAASVGSVIVYVNSAGQLATLTSSRRYKENIMDLKNSSERFMQLRPVAFNYKKYTAKDIQYGLIAEEVQKLYPEMVINNENGEPETIAYQYLFALLIKMIQENRKEIELLKTQTCTCN